MRKWACCCLNDGWTDDCFLFQNASESDGDVEDNKKASVDKRKKKKEKKKKDKKKKKRKEKKRKKKDLKINQSGDGEAADKVNNFFIIF